MMEKVGNQPQRMALRPSSRQMITDRTTHGPRLLLMPSLMIGHHCFAPLAWGWGSTTKCPITNSKQRTMFWKHRKLRDGTRYGSTFIGTMAEWRLLTQKRGSGVVTEI